MLRDRRRRLNDAVMVLNEIASLIAIFYVKVVFWVKVEIDRTKTLRNDKI